MLLGLFIYNIILGRKISNLFFFFPHFSWCAFTNKESRSDIACRKKCTIHLQNIWKHHCIVQKAYVLSQKIVNGLKLSETWVKYFELLKLSSVSHNICNVWLARNYLINQKKCIDCLPKNIDILFLYVLLSSYLKKNIQ